MKALVRDIYSLVSKFGPRGLMLYARLVALNRAAPPKVHVLHVPGLGDIRLRSGTSDANAFFHVIAREEYRLPWSWDTVHDVYSDVYQSILNRGGVPLILDCGANVGFASLWFAKKFPRAIIYAVEPDRNNYAVLCENAKNSPNIVPILGGIWDRTTSLNIIDASVAADCREVAEGSGHDSVPAYTIDDLMVRAQSHDLMVAKIDIEGAEETLFRSNTEWLREANILAVELHDTHFPGRCVSRNFFAAIAANSFDVAFKDTVAFCRRVKDLAPSASHRRAA